MTGMIFQRILVITLVMMIMAFSLGQTLAVTSSSAHAGNLSSASDLVNVQETVLQNHVDLQQDDTLLGQSETMQTDNKIDMLRQRRWGGCGYKGMGCDK